MNEVRFFNVINYSKKIDFCQEVNELNYVKKFNKEIIHKKGTGKQRVLMVNRPESAWVTLEAPGK